MAMIYLSKEHNLHFQSVFTTKEPLSLSRLCKMKLHDAADSGKIPSELLPQEMQKSTPVMEDFSISVAGILKLLKNLKPGKAAGPDRLKPILLKELCEEIAPIIQVIGTLHPNRQTPRRVVSSPSQPYLQKR